MKMSLDSADNYLRYALLTTTYLFILILRSAFKVWDFCVTAMVRLLQVDWRRSTWNQVFWLKTTSEWCRF